MYSAFPWHLSTGKKFNDCQSNDDDNDDECY